MTPVEEITNWEVFLWSLYELGGAEGYIDVEDVFLRSFEIAPSRLSWRTRDDLPDYKKCSKALRDAEARRPRLLIKAGGGHRRQLSAEGQSWIESNRARLGDVLSPGRTVQEPRSRPRARHLAELETSDAFSNWVSGGGVIEDKWRAAELLHCSPDSAPDVWQSRIQVLRAAANAGGKVEVLEFLEELVRVRNSWFAEEVR